MTALVVARDVVKRWGSHTVFTGITLDIPPGVTGLLGANGTGKTTLLGMLLGLHRPDSGQLEVLGMDPAHAGPSVRARLGYAPEHVTLPTEMRAYDLVAHLAEVHGLPRKAATARASDALFQVGLGEERFRPVGTMSTGQKQRVKLAAALAHDPEVLLLDEPTDGLDPVQRDDMLHLVRRVGHEFGISVVLSSHLLEEVERVCDGAVIIGDGRVLAAGPLDTLRARDQGWVVEVVDGSHLLATALAGAGAQVHADGHRLVVRGAGPAEVQRAVAHLGLALVRLQPRRLTLEEVFLARSEGSS